MILGVRVIRGHEAAHGGGVEAGAEVVETGFGVAFFAGEFITCVVRRRIGASNLSTERVEVMGFPRTAVCVVAHSANATEIVRIVEMPSITVGARSSDEVSPPSASERNELERAMGVGDHRGIVRRA